MLRFVIGQLPEIREPGRDIKPRLGALAQTSAALIGLSVGQAIEFETPGHDKRSLTVLGMSNQPVVTDMRWAARLAFREALDPQYVRACEASCFDLTRHASSPPNSAAKRFSPVRVKLTTRLPGAESRAAQFSSVKRRITAAPSVPAR
jgi:hypothetical protein